MGIVIAVDANPILAALMGGYARMILFDPRFRFITTRFTLREVQRYLVVIAKKSGISMADLNVALPLLPLEVIEPRIYQDALPSARHRIFHIDKDDVEILALALHFQVPLWSNDAHFGKVKPQIHLMRTRDFIL